MDDQGFTYEAELSNFDRFRAETTGKFRLIQFGRRNFLILILGRCIVWFLFVIGVIGCVKIIFNFLAFESNSIVSILDQSFIVFLTELLLAIYTATSGITGIYGIRNVRFFKNLIEVQLSTNFIVSASSEMHGFCDIFFLHAFRFDIRIDCAIMRSLY